MKVLGVYVVLFREAFPIRNAGGKTHQVLNTWTVYIGLRCILTDPGEASHMAII